MALLVVQVTLGERWGVIVLVNAEPSATWVAPVELRLVDLKKKNIRFTSDQACVWWLHRVCYFKDRESRTMA